MALPAGTGIAVFPIRVRCEEPPMNPFFRLIIIASVAVPAAETLSWKFDFGQGPVEDGYTQVLPTALYSKAYASDNVTGYFGFENWQNTRVTFLDRGGTDSLTRDIVVGSGMNIPFYFSVNVPEGKYSVTFTIGDQADTANTTIKAESRRLLVKDLRTSAGQFVTRTFTVVRRDPAITSTRSVSLDYSYGREDPALCLGWDRKLTFEFNGPRPAIAAVEIVKVDTGVTLHLAGNSTVVEQEDEPWASWGQMAPVFFNASVIVNDLALSGLTSANFIGQRRLEKICSVMKPGDYLFYEFGHNDSKNTGWETSMTNTMQAFNDSAKAHNATMVFVTPVPRRGDTDTAASVGGSAELVRTNARTLGARLLDLNALFMRCKAALGNNSAMAYAHFAANALWPDQPAINDDTHFSDYGAYEVARCVIQNGLKNAGLPVYKHLLDTILFNPAQPDNPATWKLGVSLDTLFRHSSGVVGAKSRTDCNRNRRSHSLAVNPASSLISGFENYNGTIELCVCSVNGKVLLRQKMVVTRSDRIVPWNALTTLTQGVYFLLANLNEEQSISTFALSH
jgi:lysophospholipase L1-like esterase